VTAGAVSSAGCDRRDVAGSPHQGGEQAFAGGMAGMQALDVAATVQEGEQPGRTAGGQTERLFDRRRIEAVERADRARPR